MINRWLRTILAGNKQYGNLEAILQSWKSSASTSISRTFDVERVKLLTVEAFPFACQNRQDLEPISNFLGVNSTVL